MLACWVRYYCDGIHDLYLLTLRILNDLCKNFPNHVNICLSLQDVRNINCSWLLIFWISGCLDPIFVHKIWRSWALIWHLVIKCSSSSTSRHQAHSLCFGSVLGQSRYLYWLTCSMGFPLKNTFKFSSVSKHIDLVLSSFTIILLFEQNFNRPFNCFCKPVGVSENKIRSSPYKMWAMISFEMAMPTSADKYVLRSDMYLRNINPLEIPPWLTPKLFGTARLSLPLRLTWRWVLP